jgi:VanZ like family
VRPDRSGFTKPRQRKFAGGFWSSQTKPHDTEILLVALPRLRHHCNPFMAALRKLIFWIPALSCAGLIFFLSAQSQLPQVWPQFKNMDKVEHFIAYTVLWFCVLLPLRYGHRLSLFKAILLAFLITSAYGASDEFHQRFVPNRSSDVADWAADTFACFIAASAYWIYESHSSSKTHR